MPQDEKSERFRRIAELRTNKVLTALRVLGNCSNSHNYHYTDEEVKQIFDVIESKTREIKSKFKANKTDDDTSFKLK